MKLFVTGGAGFIGSNFIHYWLKKYPQDSIVNFDKLTYAGNLESLRDVENNPNYSFVQGDICDGEAVEKAMKGSEVVVHFAAESHVDRSILSAAPFIQTNIVGTHVLLEAALELNIQRFHHISTDEVFGALELNSTEKFNEKTPYNPRSPYSASKASSDHLVRAYNVTYGLPTTISNCSNNYGPFMFPEKLFSLAITNILEEKKVPVYGDGLDGVSAVYMAERLGIATDLGGLKALKDLHEAIVELSQEEVDAIRDELLLESGEYADSFTDDYVYEEDIASEDELEDAPEPIVEVRTAPTEETVAIQRLQLVLGHVGLTGVDIVMIAEHFAVPLDDVDAVGEIIKEISHASDQELEELRFQSDADVVSRKPQNIAEALVAYRKALAQIHDEHENVEDDSQGTTNTVVDDSGEEFEI
jgi:nucleoside-diphosphate-sugar epimerase